MMSADSKTSSGVMDFIHRWWLSGQVRFLHGEHSRCLLRIVRLLAVRDWSVVISFGALQSSLIESSAFLSPRSARIGRKNSRAIASFHGQVSAVSVEPKMAMVGVWSAAAMCIGPLSLVINKSSVPMLSISSIRLV